MIKYLNKYIILICLLSLMGCGYSPILSKTDYDFRIQIEETFGNEEVNKYIKNNVERLSGNKVYFLTIDSTKDKIIISKDNKGDPTILEIKISVNYKIKYNDKIILEREIMKNSTYNNITDKFELKNFEQSLTKSLSDNVANNITGSIFSLIK